MEGTVAASVPPSQPAALPAQTPPKKNKATKNAPKKYFKATQKASKPPRATPPTVQQTTYTTHDSQQITVAAAQQLPTPVWQRGRGLGPPPAQQTLPAVQEFLQKAYETVQRSQHNATVAARNPRDKASAQPTPQIATNAPMMPKNTAITRPLSPATMAMAYHPAHVMKSSRPLFTNNAVIREMQPNFHASAHPTPQSSTNNMRQPYYANQTRYTSNISTQMNHATVTNNIQYSTYYSHQAHATHVSAAQAGTVRNMGYSGYVYYNANWQGKPKHPQVQEPEKRSLLVAKRRQNPTVPTVVESSETGPAEKTQKSENTSNTESPPTSGATNVSKKAESAQPLQTLTAPTSTASEPQKPAQSPKNSPAKYSTSRIAQTYQTHIAAQKERGLNGSQSSNQAPKNNNAQNTQSNANGPSRPNGPGGLNGAQRQVPRPPEPDPKKRVLVSGFPPYTQSQDLIRVLKKFGNCQVDKCRNRLAVVTYETEAAVKAAIEASDDISIYGEFLEITAYTNARHVEDMFRAYKKVISTQKGQDIIQPNKIDLSGDFYQQLDNIEKAIRLTREQVMEVTKLFLDLERVLQTEWPGCVTIPFGSIPTGLGIASSDADCFVELPPDERRRGSAAFVLRVRRLLATYPRLFAQLVAIPRANTPIVKFRHVPSGFHCDVSSKTPLGAQNSKLIKTLLEGDPRLSPVAVLVKYWAKVHELSGTGRLTNYALTMMVVFYLQQPSVALVAPVVNFQRDPHYHFIVDHWNAGFTEEFVPIPGQPSAAPVPDLFGGFFEFYAGFDFEQLVVCPFLGAPVRKSLFDEPERLPPEFERYVTNVRENLASPIRHNTAFCVQDPFEQSHNVASSVCPRLAADIRAYMKFAADAYAADRAAGCAALLRTVLLQRPKLRRENTTPTTKVFLIPRIRAEIADPDWRARVRQVVLETIFEQILKIRLKRDHERELREMAEEEKREAEWEERERRRAEKKGKAVKEEDRAADRVTRRLDKEKYSGSTAKPVWRRRKNYSMGALEAAADLVLRQRRATDQILNSAADAPLQFHLELGYRDRPRHCYVYARLVDGDLEAFRGFVGFLHSVMIDWFRILMRPYLAPFVPEDADADEDADDDPDEGAVCSIQFEPDDDVISRDIRAVSLTDTEEPTADTDSSSADSSKRDLTDIH